MCLIRSLQLQGEESWGTPKQKYPQYCQEFHDQLWEALSGTTSEKRGVPSRTGGERILETLWKPQMPWIIGVWGIPAVLFRGIPGNALRAFPGSFRNFSGISSGKSQPYWGCGPRAKPPPKWAFAFVSLAVSSLTRVSVPCARVNSGSFARGRCRWGRSEISHFCSKLLLFALVHLGEEEKSEENEEKRKKKNEKMRKKNKKCVKKGENHSDPIYTNPIKNLPINPCLSLQSNLKHGWFTWKFPNHIWNPQFAWIAQQSLWSRYTQCCDRGTQRGGAHTIFWNNPF